MKDNLSEEINICKNRSRSLIHVISQLYQLQLTDTTYKLDNRTEKIITDEIIINNDKITKLIFEHQRKPNWFYLF
jgi:hypothetical protein